MAYDTGNYTASLDLALEMADYKNFAKRKKDSAKNGKLRGIGFSAYIEACGIAPSAAVGSLGAGVGLWESAEIRVNPVGTVEVLTGSHSHGQGHETTFAQLVADRLGIDIEAVSVVHGDTDKVQFGMGTYGSRSGAVGMSAIVKAVDKVIAKGKKVAAYALEAAEKDIEFKDGRFKVAGTDKSLAFGEVALQAYIAHKFTGAELEPGLKEGAFYDPTNFTFPSGVHICEVEIDPDTGIFTYAATTNAVKGIVWNIDKLRPYGYNYTDGTYTASTSDNCNYQQTGIVASGGKNAVSASKSGSDTKGGYTIQVGSFTKESTRRMHA